MATKKGTLYRSLLMINKLFSYDFSHTLMTESNRLTKARNTQPHSYSAYNGAYRDRSQFP